MFRRRHIGGGSHDCRLLIIIDFHHCHSGTTFAPTEGACGPRPAHLGRSGPKICFSRRRMGLLEVSAS